MLPLLNNTPDTIPTNSYSYIPYPNDQLPQIYHLNPLAEKNEKKGSYHVIYYEKEPIILRLQASGTFSYV